MAEALLSETDRASAWRQGAIGRERERTASKDPVERLRTDSRSKTVNQLGATREALKKNVIAKGKKMAKVYVCEAKNAVLLEDIFVIPTLADTLLRGYATATSSKDTEGEISLFKTAFPPITPFSGDPADMLDAVIVLINFLKAIVIGAFVLSIVVIIYYIFDAAMNLSPADIMGMVGNALWGSIKAGVASYIFSEI